jgi:hypothetical protein
MSVTATKSEDWEVVEFDPQRILRAVDGVLYGYDHFVYSVRRKHVGVTAIAKETGTLTATLNLPAAYTSPTAQLSMSGLSISAKWMCTQDRLSDVEQVTGLVWQHQTWETYTQPEVVEWAEFEDVGGGA